MDYVAEDYDLHAMQQHELVLFDEFVRVCEQNNIPYFLAYGTLLGAARHGGFIPWDDDIDVFVFARDLESLYLAMERDLDHERFFYQCPQTDSGFNMTITRLRENGTTALTVENADRDMHQGVFIDIYPLHEMGPTRLRRLRQQCWSMVNCLLTVRREPLNHGLVGRVLYRLGMALFDRPGILDRSRRARDQYLGETAETICSLCSDWNTIKREFPSSMFGVSRMTFEQRAACVPTGWERFLRMRYGDWRELPPADQRHGQHTIYFFDPDHSYEVYKGVKYFPK